MSSNSSVAFFLVFFYVVGVVVDANISVNSSLDFLLGLVSDDDFEIWVVSLCSSCSIEGFGTMNESRDTATPSRSVFSVFSLGVSS
ncbi:hypothetical protein QBC38DRAFT_477246 [Podospora fimiseda]|uniref:Secreted protein n=1 Tax=Podospora fimiseda TaxID=252190 RepID=A0AAN7BQC1_9PEZI|nr:hypothetical protein QBC38DRAFT_477246 [Podospora fimiseda]